MWQFMFLWSTLTLALGFPLMWVEEELKKRQKGGSS